MSMNVLAHDLSNRKDGPRLVLIHGFASNRSWFAPLMAAWSNHGSAVAVDLRGHGDSGYDGTDRSYAELATEVGTLIERLDCSSGEPVVAVGHSMGAAVALELATQCPTLIDGVVLLDPLPIVMSPTLRRAFEDFGGVFATDDWSRALQGMVVSNILDGDRVSGDEIEAIVASCRRTPRPVMANTARQFGCWDGAATAARCRCPVLHLSAAACRPELGGAVTTLARALAVAERFPEWHFGQVVGPGHVAMLRDVKQLVPMIDRFISGFVGRS